MAVLRLDKILSDSGLYSRSEAKNLIKAGRVTVNGSPIRQSEYKVNTDEDEICVNGSPLSYSEYRYVLMNKPEGLLSATEDRNAKTVIDLLSPELKALGLFPVGRLDKDTTGLLLLTNDGDFAHRVISPKHLVPKVYRAELDGCLDAEDVAAFKSGIILGDGTKCMPAGLSCSEPCIGYAEVMEGKYHQVKRMFASRGKTVLHLHRLSEGALSLPPDMLPGQWREISRETAYLALQSK